MKISLNWISDFVDLTIVDKKSLENVVVGYVETLKKHPDADNLNIAEVNVGEETLQIVCGGINLKAKVYVPVAKVGAVLPGNFSIQKAKIRGQESSGMICAKEELGLGVNPPREVWILDPKKKWLPGTPLLTALKIDGLSAEDIGKDLTAHTAEVEGIENEGEKLGKVVTGKLLEFEKITGSEKLHKGLFDLGWKKSQVVFGSVHVLHPGDILPIALPGAKLPGGEIKVSEMLGVKSEGMVCTDSELGIQNSADGLTRFPAKTTLGMPLSDALCMNDWVVEIDNKSLTHRPDLWGHYGIARELAAIYSKKLKPLDTFIKIPAPKGKHKVHIDIHDKDLCPRFSSAIMTGIRIAESPQWLKARLQAAGMNAHNNIVDITNYVMLELGQPMHAYDRAVLGADTLRVRYAKKGEKLVTLDESEQTLTPEDPLITNGQDQPVGLAGIKGGLKSGISQNTTEIILECAAFDPVIVRKSSMRHALRTDASQRFEKSLDPALTQAALQRAIHLILELCPGAELAGPLETAGTWKPKKITLSIDPAVVCSKIGVEIPVSKMTTLLRSLEFDVKKMGKKLSVTVPSHRATKDVGIAEDIVEEIARMYGYNAIPALLPTQAVRLPQENVERKMEHKARKILALELGFTEVRNYSFYGEDRLKKCGLNEADHLKVLNYLSLDQTHMRTSLTPNLLANIAANERDYADIRIFEIGHTYKEVGQFMPLEKNRLTAVIAHPSECFYDAKGALESFLRSLGIPHYELKPSMSPLSYAHPKKSMDLSVAGETVGVLFALHPGTLKAFDITHQVALFSVEFTALVNTSKDATKFTPLPKFPSLPFDLSLLVEKRKTVAEIEDLIRNEDQNKWIESIHLFDIYEGTSIPQGKKSLSFGITLRHPDRTLTDADFQTFYSSLVNALETQGITIRGS